MKWPSLSKFNLNNAIYPFNLILDSFEAAIESSLFSFIEQIQDNVLSNESNKTSLGNPNFITI
jgi:hypothetical protein